MQHFNQLTPAEAERLAILAEECAEVIQVVGKILRHGYDSHHPLNPDGPDNRKLLAIEIGHFEHIMLNMVDAREIDPETVNAAACDKRAKIGRYLHHAG